MSGPFQIFIQPHPAVRKHFHLPIRQLKCFISSPGEGSFMRCNCYLTFGVYRVYRRIVMLTKRKILVVIGIIVAILITFYTGVFGISSVA